MPSPLEVAGAAVQPVSAAPLHTNEFFTGMWTNGNPLGPGPVPYLYQRFYNASRYDRLVDGNDTEISPRLTLIRRPGHTVYNPGPFPPINRFYEFRGFTANDEMIRLMADCDPGTGSASPTVREVTQPATNTILRVKSPKAGRTSFVSVGNILYGGDGVDTWQWVTSAKSWTAATQYQPGDFIIDPNGNIQMAVGSVTANVVNIQVEDRVLSGGIHGRKVTLYFSTATPFDVPSNIRITTSGLTTVPAANETTPYTLQVVSTLQAFWIEQTTSIPITVYSPETGQATTGTGITGATPPTWNATISLVTQDGGNQWVCMGPAMLPWGSAGPTDAPTVTTAVVPSIYPNVAPSTWYAPLGNMVISDGTNLQQLVDPGGDHSSTTGGSAPTWQTAVGAITHEVSPGTASWKCLGGGAWQASHAYAVGDTIKATYTYTTNQWQQTYQNGNVVWVFVQTQVTTTSFFQCIQAGTSGMNQPSWVNGIGTVTYDPDNNHVIWSNLGSSASGVLPGWPGATQNLSAATQVVDPNGYFQKPTKQGMTAASGTNYSKTIGASTTDGGQVWTNAGPYSPAVTDVWHWAYSGKNSITGDVSPASPTSAPLAPGIGQLPVVQGQGLPNPPWDTIVLWRTAAGGSTLMYDDEFPNPGPNATWVYTDFTLDPGNTSPNGNAGILNPNTLAPIGSQNAPPPVGFIPEAYYLGRIWGYVNNQLVWSNGPDQGAVAGSGNSAFNPINQFRFPAKGVLCWPTSIGLICYTTADIWAVLGQGTPNSPFYVINFQAGIGMASADAFGVNGSTAYGMLTSHQLVSMDPGAGETEVGFPIADWFDQFFDPKLAYVVWHQGRSADTALYVSNGSSFWFRMTAVSAPESGNVWSPAAVIRAPGQVRAIASIEITPGDKVLVLGPHIDGNPILKRDPSVNSDNLIAYPAHATIAPVVIAQPGTTAGVQFVVTEEKEIAGASSAVIKMLFDEIMFGSTTIHTSDWRQLRNNTLDPPNLPRQKSVRVQRLWGLQDPSTVIKCRFYEQDISWPAEDFPNELMTNTVYGRLPEKARK